MASSTKQVSTVNELDMLESLMKNQATIFARMDGLRTLELNLVEKGISVNVKLSRNDQQGILLRRE